MSGRDYPASQTFADLLDTHGAKRGGVVGRGAAMNSASSPLCVFDLANSRASLPEIKKPFRADALAAMSLVLDAVCAADAQLRVALALIRDNELPVRVSGLNVARVSLGDLAHNINAARDAHASAMLV